MHVLSRQMEAYSLSFYSVYLFLSTIFFFSIPCCHSIMFLFLPSSVSLGWSARRIRKKRERERENLYRRAGDPYVWMYQIGDLWYIDELLAFALLSFSVPHAVCPDGKKNLDNRRAPTIKARGVKKDAIDGDYTDNDTRTHWYYHVCTPSECSVSMAPRILSKTL